MIKNKDDWQRAFEKQMDIAERKTIPTVKRYYKAEYKKAIKSFVAMNPSNYNNVFLAEGMTKIYRDLYVKIGMQFANWYARNFDKYISKGVNPRQYQSFWQEKFAYLGMSIGAQRVTLVSGTAKKTLRTILTKFMQDEEFMMLGAAKQARILRNTFNRYSTNQATRLVRTEATAAANYATMQSAQTIFPGAQMMKEWVASFDDRTRDAHAEAGASQPIPYDESFLVGGEFMQYPGDPAGSAANVVNCRCSVAPFPAQNAEGIADIEDIAFGLGGGGRAGFGIGDVVTNIATTNVVSQNLGFTPAKSLKEAEERFLKYAPKVNFQGLNLAQQNEILQAIEEILGKYNVTLAKDIGFQVKRRRSLGVAGRSYDNVPQYIRIQKTFSKNSLKTQKETVSVFSKSLQMRIKKLQTILQEGTRPQALLDRARKNLESLLNMRRWAMYQEGARPLYTTTIHEAFHVVDYQYGLRDIFRRELTKQNVQRSDWYKVSEYGGSNIAELFTETATAIHQGISIPVEFINAFNETIKTIKL